MTDNEFIKIYNENKHIYNKIPCLCKHIPDVNLFLISRFNDSHTKVESAYRILHNIEQKPICPVCGKILPFVSMQIGYKTFCCNECKNTEKGKQYCKDKLKNSMLKKYGVENPMQLDIFKEKSKQTCLKNYGCEYPSQDKDIREKQMATMQKKYGVSSALQSKKFRDKFTETMQEKYGVSSALQSKKFRDKFTETMQERYGVNYTGESDILKHKMMETSLKKYGVINPAMSDDIKQKVINTNLKQYGVEYIAQSPIIKQRMQENNMRKYGVKFTTQLESTKQKVKETNIQRYGENYLMKFSNKGQQTKRQNGTFATSSVETTLYKKLCKYFDSENIIKQYKSELYPFNCDFYIKSENLYIEIQGSWTHGSHPYNEKNEDDIILKNKWENKWKNKGSDYYKCALDVWIYRDTKKRNIAKTNNINFIEIFSINSEYCLNCILSYINEGLHGYMIY